MNFLSRLPRIGLELNGQPLAVEIALADGFLSRLRGLMFAPPLHPGGGLLIVPCNGIHALFMRGEFEAVFLSKDGRVLRIASPIRPWRDVSLCPGAHAVLEWRVGEAVRLGVREGSCLQWTKPRGEGKRQLAKEDDA
jgi:uncharacterized membrane protein (UPF0127 family)